MITVKDAVAKAWKYLNEVFGAELRGIQLEEVDRSPDDEDWLITISFLREKPPVGLPTPFSNDERVYKQITVNGKSGACQSIKIRQLQ
jgi:hypothetical protein